MTARSATAVTRYFSLIGLFCANALTVALFARTGLESVALMHASMGVVTLGLLMSEGGER